MYQGQPAANPPAQQTGQQAAPPPPKTLADAAVANFSTFLVIIALLIVVLAQMVMAWWRDWNTNAIKIVGFTTLAFVAVFAALTVSNTQNGSAVFGLLGTIAGYLAGKGEDALRQRSKGDSRKPEPDAKNDEPDGT